MTCAAQAGAASPRLLPLGDAQPGGSCFPCGRSPAASAGTAQTSHLAGDPCGSLSSDGRGQEGPRGGGALPLAGSGSLPGGPCPDSGISRSVTWERFLTSLCLSFIMGDKRTEELSWALEDTRPFRGGRRRRLSCQLQERLNTAPQSTGGENQDPGPRPHTCQKGQ